MSKNTLKIIFVILIAVCLYSLYISGLEVNATYDRIDELETENALIKNDNDVLRSKIEILELELEEARNLEDVLSDSTYIGDFEITYYCPCEICCGKSDGITYTGTKATEGRTIAVDPNTIPLGSVVLIDGQEYIAEDIGGVIKDLKLDMFVSDHQRALELGRTVKEVYLIGAV